MIPDEQRERMIRSSATENERFLLGLLDEARAAQPMEPGRWWRAVDADGDVWCESSIEDEVREMARPTDAIQRLYESSYGEWRDQIRKSRC